MLGFDIYNKNLTFYINDTKHSSDRAFVEAMKKLDSPVRLFWDISVSPVYSFNALYFQIWFKIVKIFLFIVKVKYK